MSKYYSRKVLREAWDKLEKAMVNILRVKDENLPDRIGEWEVERVRAEIMHMTKAILKELGVKQ